MRPWAQTVVAGRARLGGIPVGVIAVETRTVELNLPADPANLSTEGKIVSQAGQVWFPDSAFKTSQAIKDFGHEGLPLMIFANWRGFSGGMKDMYEQILKFGSYIVDELQMYKQPILTYIPPNGELRGGAWAVVDTSINPSHIEMYADPDSRGSVLEPEGVAEIKYRLRDVVKTMHRLDPKIIKIKAEIAANPNMPLEDKNRLEAEIVEREQFLQTMYHQVAVHFVELHDTPERMLAKGVIVDIVPWRDSRRLLYGRLRRLIVENRIKKQIIALDTSITNDQAKSMLSKWFLEQKGDTEAYLWFNNEAAFDWLSEQLDAETGNILVDSFVGKRVFSLQKNFQISDVDQVARNSPEVIKQFIATMYNSLPAEQRSEMLNILSESNKDDDNNSH